LYLANSDGTDARKIASALGGPWLLHWSADGTRLRFTMWQKNHNFSIWEVSADGSHLHCFLPQWSKPPAGETGGIWTWDGKYFLFNSDRMPGFGGLWAFREEASLFQKARTQPVQLGTGSASSPFPSPDGKTIFALSGGQSREEIARCDLKSGHFVSYLPAVHADSFDISRDGDWIAYSTYDGLFRSKLDGSQRLQLAVAPGQSADDIRWSPDGKQVAFIVSAGGMFKIQVVPMDARMPQALASETGEERHPDWSPDGNAVVFDRNSGVAMTIQVIDLRTRKISTLAGSDGLKFPRWSPDGHHLVALSTNQQEFRLFDFAAQKWTTLAKDPAAQFDLPVWSKDGKTIYFINSAPKVRAIFGVGIVSRRSEKVASLSDLWKPLEDVTWMALAPDGSPALSANGSSNEIFAYTWEAP
jgi:Tol biopolymer transport system component